MGNNCTSCANKFWYNFQCVDECPESFYVDSTYACRECDQSIPQCTEAQLTFSIHVYTIDYTLYADIVFSKPVQDLSAETLRSIAKFNTKTGPVKPNLYTVAKKNDTVYTCTFIDSSSLNEQSLSLSFDPGFIFDVNGVPLADSTFEVPVSVVTSVS